jgi:hypothetical protein
MTYTESIYSIGWTGAALCTGIYMSYMIEVGSLRGGRSHYTEFNQVLCGEQCVLLRSVLVRLSCLVDNSVYYLY